MRADSQKIIRLLRTARGQVEGVLKMVEEDRYCVDVVNQLLAAEAVLRRAHCEVLRAHLEYCVTGAFSAGGAAAREKAAEMMGIIDKISK